MSELMNRLQTGVLVLAAIALAGSVVHREFMTPVRASPEANSRDLEFVEGWSEALRIGALIGDSGAPVKVVEFTDLECPYCRGFNATLKSLRDERPGKVAVVLVHFPMPTHRFALPAARFVECAASFGRFAQAVDAVYNKQDSLGLKSWESYANDAGIPEPAEVGRCAERSESVARIEAGEEFGERIGVRGTPTVLMNGWRFAGTPSKRALLAAVDSLVEGKSPIGAKHVSKR